MIASPTLKKTKTTSKTKTAKAIKNIDRLIELISNQKPQTFTVKSPQNFLKININYLLLRTLLKNMNYPKKT